MGEESTEKANTGSCHGNCCNTAVPHEAADPHFNSRVASETRRSRATAHLCSPTASLLSFPVSTFWAKGRIACTPRWSDTAYTIHLQHRILFLSLLKQKPQPPACFLPREVIILQLTGLNCPSHPQATHKPTGPEEHPQHWPHLHLGRAWSQQHSSPTLDYFCTSFKADLLLLLACCGASPVPDGSVCLHLSRSNCHIKYYIPLNSLRQRAHSKNICP